jgi:hypothetical protein
MITASLSGGQSEAALSVGFPRPGAAQVNHGSEVLLVMQRNAGNSLMFERCGDTAIQERRC